MSPYISEYLNKYIDEFKKLSIQIHALVLFGSQARGTATISSDVDIAVVMDSSLTRRERGILRCLGEDINPYVETNLFFTTLDDLANPTHHFDTNKYIKNEGVVLWGELAI